MKIALLIDRFAIGGGLEHIYQITRYLSDFTFGIFAKGGDALDKFSKLPEVQLFPEGYSRQYLQIFQPDLLHVHHLRPLLELYKNPFRNPAVPVLYTLHGAHIRKYTFKKGLLHKPAYFIRYHLEKHLFKLADRVITVSQADFQLMRKLYELQNVIHIPNGLDRQKFWELGSIDKAEIRRKYQLPENKLLFLTVARFDYVKGHDVLLRAILSMRESVKDEKIQFILVGEGREYKRIQKFVKENSLEKYVVFLKKLYPLNEILAASDVFILPSRWEGMPLVLLEAGYFKLPVIVSSAEANREIIQDSENGIIFRNQDSEHLARIILKVLEGQYNLPQLGERLYQDVLNKYDLVKSMDHLSRVYRKMAE
jgi:glycosyltransferase involved in cell wall biosynthesis